MKKPKKSVKMTLSVFVLTVAMMWSIVPTQAFALPNESVSTFSGLQTAISTAPTDGTEYIIEVTADIVFPSALVIPAGKNIRVISDGSGPWILTALSTRNFNVNRFGILTLESVTIDGGGTGGGVFVAAGTLTLEAGATIRNCYSAYNGGGILAADDDYVSVVTLKSGSVVSGNVANANVSNIIPTVGRGGGVYANPATFTMENGAVVSNNTATYAGGILAGGTATINGTVSSNSAYRSAGGIYYLQIGTQVLSMDGAEVTGNIAHGYSTSSYEATGGGGLYFITSNYTSGDISIKNSVFSNNQAPTTRNTSINGGLDYLTGQQNGGAIYVSNNKSIDTKMLIEDCLFTNNEARLGGGVSLNCEVEIIDTVFEGNTAYDDIHASEASGGAIYFNSSKRNTGNTYLLLVSGGAIKDNSAAYAAGIMFTNTTVYQVFVDGTEFSNNQITDEGYAWDVNNPTGYEGILQSVFGGLSYAGVYERNITNVTTATSPYSNIYNNADIQFMLIRIVTYDGNGGAFLYSDINSEFGSSYTSDLPIIAFSYYQSDLLRGLTSVPYKSGDTFLGWFLADLETPAPGAGAPVSENFVFYALWQSMVHTVTYHPGTTESVLNMPQPDTVTAVAGSTFSVSSSVPDRLDHSFTGWNTEADGSGTSYIPDETFMLTAGVTLYAQWTKSSITSPGGTTPGGTSPDATSPGGTVSPKSTKSSAIPPTGDAGLFVLVPLLTASLVLLCASLVIKRQRNRV